MRKNVTIRRRSFRLWRRKDDYGHSWICREQVKLRQPNAEAESFLRSAPVTHLFQTRYHKSKALQSSGPPPMMVDRRALNRGPDGKETPGRQALIGRERRGGKSNGYADQCNSGRSHFDHQHGW